MKFGLDWKANAVNANVGYVAIAKTSHLMSNSEIAPMRLLKSWTDLLLYFFSYLFHLH